MKLLTVTSDNYVEHTVLLLASLRIWHPDLPVTVYALEQGWSDQATERLQPFHVTMRTISEDDVADRNGPHQGLHTIFKLDALIEQTEPFLYLDSDILILQPLDGMFDRIASSGWLTVHDHETLDAYHAGEITELVELPDELRSQRSYNAGVCGCDPKSHPEFMKPFLQAKTWAGRIQSIYCGDQALQNLAWHHLFGRIPPNAGFRFNAGVDTQGRFDLGAVAVHLCGGNFKAIHEDKLQAQAAIWNAWPQGERVIDLEDTRFWRESLPHPWSWPNQCNQRQHRAAVLAIRQASRALLDEPALVVVRDEHQAYLLDQAVLDHLTARWTDAAPRFAPVPHRGSFHLTPESRPRPAAGPLARLASTVKGLVGG